jgi:hypothetical protein
MATAHQLMNLEPVCKALRVKVGLKGASSPPIEIF